MMKKMWKNRSGVSPVIATILMVAITVVLAAVLYVMVMGFGGPSNNVPTGSFSAKDKVTGGEKLTFGVITPEKAPTALKVSITTSAGTDVYTWAADDSKTLTSTTTLTGVTAVGYTDLAGNKIVNNGDYLSITAPAGSYTVALLYASSGDQITSTTFTI